MEPYELTIAEASRLIQEGKLTPTRLLESILKRIDGLEPVLEAWVTMDEERAMSDAEALTREAEEGSLRGPVHGIPVGVKDIYFTQGLRTTMGSSIYADYIPEYDAETVAILREAGAVIPGKTETTEFAAYDPAARSEPLEHRAYPGGLQQRLRGRRLLRDVPRGPGLPDRGLRDPPRRLLRSRRPQAHI